MQVNFKRKKRIARIRDIE